MFFVYILQSQTSGRFYIGYSEFPERRLTEHNSGKVKSTRPFRPWIKVHTESFASEAEAIRREKSIKAMKSRIYIQNLIDKTRSDWSRDLIVKGQVFWSGSHRNFGACCDFVSTPCNSSACFEIFIISVLNFSFMKLKHSKPRFMIIKNC